MDFNDIVINEYRKLQSLANNDIYNVTCQFLTIEQGIAHPHGSGVFIKINNFYFLLTAAHVTDNQHSNICVGIDNHNVLTLGGEWTGNIADGNREDDRIDLAILKLDDVSIEKVKTRYSFLDISEIEVNHNFKSLPFYQLLGYPITLSKYKKFKNETKSIPFFYITMPAEKNIYKELKCDDNINFIIKYDKKNVKNYTNNRIELGPDLFGISGCGLWYIPMEFGNGKSNIKKKLVGIITEWPINKRKYIIGTRIDLFLKAINLKYKI